MNNTLISIIIPVYNVEKYVDQCLFSIFSQSYSNIQIIVVDDGSTDSSSKLCDSLIANDDRVIVVHKKNGGLSDARNMGIELSSGDYLSFVDSDDFVDREYISELYLASNKFGSDISLAGYFEFSDMENLPLLSKYDPDIKCISSKEAINQLFGDNVGTFVVAWCKLFKSCLFKNLRFPKGRIHEDQFLAHRLYYSANMVSIIERPLYFYRRTADSITGRPLSIKNIDYLYALFDRYSYFTSIGDKELGERSHKWLLYQCRDYYYKFSAKEMHTERRTIKSLYSKILCGVITNRQIMVKEKIWLYVFRLYPKLYFRLRKVKKYG